MNNFQMESQEQYWHNQLATRDQHILFLQSQLLKLDQKYTTMINKLHIQNKKHTNQYLDSLQQQTNEYKDKYSQLYYRYKEIQEINRNQEKQVKRNNKKIEQYQEKIKKMEGMKKEDRRKCKQYEGIISSLKVGNARFYQKVGQIQKESIVIRRENQQMREWIKGCVQEMKDGCQSLRQINKYQYDEINILDGRQQNKNSNTFTQFYNNNNNKTQLNPSYTSSYNPQLQLTHHKNYNKINKNNYNKQQQQSQNLWQLDMKKLTNCLQYIQSDYQFIQTFNPSILDMLISRKLFKSIKKYIQTSNRLSIQLQLCKSQNKLQLSEMKYKLQTISQQMIQLVNNEKCQNVMIDVGVQTQLLELEEVKEIVESKLMKMSEINTRLRVRNSLYYSLLEKTMLYTVGIHTMLQASSHKIQYYKIFQNQYYKNNNNKIESSKNPQKCNNNSQQQLQSKINRKTNNIKRFRKVCMVILFVKTIQKKARKTNKLLQFTQHIALQQQQQKYNTSSTSNTHDNSNNSNNNNNNNNNNTKIYRKGLQDLLINQSKSITNIQLQKIKQKSTMSQSQQNILICQAIDYYQYKLKQIKNSQRGGDQFMNYREKLYRFGYEINNNNKKQM